MNREEKKIRRAFDQKSWNEIKTKDSWQYLRLCQNLLKDLIQWEK